jgi:putative chitinase
MRDKAKMLTVSASVLKWSERRAAIAPIGAREKPGDRATIRHRPYGDQLIPAGTAALKLGASDGDAKMINRKFFFDQVRLTLFTGSMKPAQVAGITAILDEWEANHAKDDDRWLAYMLATAHHETDRRMQPIHEYGGYKYFMARYDKTGGNPALAKQLGNTEVGDGATFHGRGFVQLTGRANYRKMSAVTGADLVAAPDRALELPIATQIMFYGMINGSFTGKKLAGYFDGPAEDWVNARKIINGTDKASTIADYGHRYYAAISYTVG